MTDEARDELVIEARDYLRLALADLSASRAIVGSHLQDPDSDPSTAVFHLQQAVEKALKCLLVLADIDFPKTHSLASLQSLLPRAFDDVASMGEVDSLTAFAVQARYPGLDMILQWDDVEGARALAALVVERTQAHLTKGR